MDFVRTICQAQGAYDGIPERMGSELSESTLLSCHAQPKPRKRNMKRKSQWLLKLVFYSSQLRKIQDGYPEAQISLDYVRLVADITEGSFFTVTKNFGGRIRRIHYFYGPCKSRDIVAVQR